MENEIKEEVQPEVQENKVVEVKQPNKKKGKGSSVIIIILLLVILGLGGYIGYNKFLNKESKSNDTNEVKKEKKTEENTTEENTTEKNTTEEENKTTEDTKTNEENKNTDNKNTSNETTSKAKCYGTYYVNGNVNEGTYLLKEDGTFEIKNEEKTGIFTINENTITFIERKHITGPRNEDPVYYNPQSYLIYDDCSKIRLTESGSHTSAWLQKAN